MRMPLPIAALLLLLGCTTLSVTSLMQLARFDVLTSDAEALRVAVKAPQALSLPPDGAVVTLGARRPDGEEVQERFVMVPAAEGEDERGLAEAAEAGFALRAYRIAPDDLPRLERTRGTIAAWKAEQGDAVVGTLAIEARPCRIGTLADGPMPVTTFLRTEAEAPYFRLTGPTDATALLDEAGAPLGEAPACPEP